MRLRAHDSIECRMCPLNGAFTDATAEPGIGAVRDVPTEIREIAKSEPHMENSVETSVRRFVLTTNSY